MNIGHETQKTIRAWAVNTFGGTGTTLSRLLRTHREMTELLDELMLATTRISKICGVQNAAFGLDLLVQEDRDRIMGEVADVVILLLDTAEAVNVVHRPGLFVGSNSVTALDRAVTANGVLSKMIDNARYMYFGRGTAHHFLTQDDLQKVSYALASIADQCGTTLQAGIDLKMRINRARQWDVDENHNGSHVKTLSPGIRFGVHEANAWAEKIAAEEARKVARDAEFAAQAIGPMTGEIAAAYLRTTSACVCGAGAN